MNTSRSCKSLTACVVFLIGVFATVDPARGGFVDCNSNTLDDECDLNCLAQAGACNVPGCGMSVDCNTNNIPDECETFVWDGGGDGINWHSANNWNPNVVPNSGAAHAIIGAGAGVVLNNAAIVAEVQLTGGSTLLISGGNLTVGSPCGMLIEGALRTKNSRNVTVAGDVVIGAEGSYEADATALATDASSLDAENITVLEGPGGSEPGVLMIDRQMSVTAQGDIVFDGTNAEPCNQLSLGGCRPPLLQIEGGAVVDCRGSLHLDFSVDVMIGTLLPVTDDFARSGPVHHHIELGGDFVNSTDVPACFNVNGGAILLNGPSAQDIEAAGFAPQNFPTAFYLTDNFAFGTMEVAGGSTIHVRNDFANLPFGGAEALVVGGLNVATGASVNAMSASLAFDQINDQGGSFNGTIRSIRELQLPAASVWGVGILGAAVGVAATLGIRRRKVWNHVGTGR